MAKILSISCYNNFEKAPLVYGAAKQVFKSLPPADLLADFSKRKYDTWYRKNFSDSSDGWNSGPSLYQSGSGAFILITPTSDRIVKVEVRENCIWNCEIIFPSGSIQAAGDILKEAQFIESAMPNYPISIVAIMDDGEVYSCHDIGQIVIEDAPVSGETWGLPDRTIRIPQSTLVSL